MPIKFRYTSREQIPTEHSAFYVERDGTFVLDVEGAVEKSRLDEFRNNNVALQKQLQELGQRFEGIDPERARALLQKQQELDDANLIKTGDVEKIVSTKLAAFQAELQKERSRAAQLQAKLEETLLTRTVTEIGTKRGLRASAIPDLQARAKRVFKIVGDAPVALEEDGQTQKAGADGSPLTLDVWVEQLAVTAPHLFEQNAGGGAVGNGSGGVGQLNHGRNPWKQETWNLTEQSKLARTNPQLAAQLKKAAGR
jgi:hypothetical protein